MRCAQREGKDSRAGYRKWVGAGMILAVCCSVSMAGHDRHSRRTESREHFDARQLFEKIWESGVGSQAGGDGLGPLFNESSCVGCHHLGGTGGAGGNESNVVILSAFAGRLWLRSKAAFSRASLKTFTRGFGTGRALWFIGRRRRRLPGNDSTT